MKKLFVYALLAGILFNNAHAQNTAKQDAVIGTWLVQDGSTKINIEKSNGKFIGKIVWLNPPLDKNGKPFMDTKNPDKTLQSHTLMGLLMLNNFSYDSDNLWTEGTIYDPDSGKTYSCKITMKDNKTIEVRGYVGISLFGRTETWKRSENISMN